MSQVPVRERIEFTERMDRLILACPIHGLGELAEGFEISKATAYSRRQELKARQALDNNKKPRAEPPVKSVPRFARPSWFEEDLFFVSRGAVR